MLLRDLRILVVDDDPETVDTFSALLEMEGANVAVATSARDALRIVDEHRPQLILSDIGMPDLSGLQFIEQVRRRNGGAEIIAIALSGYSREEDVEAATKAGFDAHLTKPVMLDTLVMTVARLRQRQR